MTPAGRKMRYKRRAGTGEMYVVPKDGSSKNRMRHAKVYAPGDQIEVYDRQQLPGYPHAMDGWEFVGFVDEDVTGKAIDPSLAILKAIHRGGGRWAVVIEVPGANYPGLAKSQQVHEEYLTRDRAEAWAELGYDPGE